MTETEVADRLAGAMLPKIDEILDRSLAPRFVEPPEYHDDEASDEFASLDLVQPPSVRDSYTWGPGDVEPPF